MKALTVWMLLVAGSAGAVTVSEVQFDMGGSPYQASGGIGLLGCISADLQGVPFAPTDYCVGIVTLEKFSQPVSDVQMMGVGTGSDNFDGAFAMAFDAQGDYLGLCTAATIFDPGVAPYPSQCSTFMGTDYWSQKFSVDLAFSGITYVTEVLPFSSGEASGGVVGFTAHQDASSVPEPATMLLVGLGLAMAVRRRKS